MLAAAMRLKLGLRIAISFSSGRTLTPICPSSSKPRQNKPPCARDAIKVRLTLHPRNLAHLLKRYTNRYSTSQRVRVNVPAPCLGGGDDSGNKHPCEGP